MKLQLAKEELQQLSGTLLISCNNHNCKKIIKRAKETFGVSSFFEIDNKGNGSIDLIVRMKNVSKNDIINAKNQISKMEDVKSIEYRISK